MEKEQSAPPAAIPPNAAQAQTPAQRGLTLFILLGCFLLVLAILACFNLAARSHARVEPGAPCPPQTINPRIQPNPYATNSPLATARRIPIPASIPNLRPGRSLRGAAAAANNPKLNSCR